MAIAQILAPTIILNEGAISATATMPSIPASTKNRCVYVTFVMYNGGGTATCPTAPICNGVTPTFICGDTSQTRLASSTWFFKESDIATITGQTLTSTTGAAGSQKSITVEVLEDVAQTTPTNINNGYVSASAMITLPLTRVANSWTIAKGFTSVSAGTLTLTNPAGTGTNNLTSTRRITYAGSSDTAQTISYTCNGANFTTTHVFNVAPFPVGTITDLNGGLPVKAGSTFTVTSSGFSPTGGTGGGKTLTGWSGSNPYTATQPAYVDGGTYPEPDTAQTFVFTDGSQSPTTSGTIASPVGMTSVVVASPITDDDTYPPYWMKQAGYEPVNGDRLIYKTSECTIAANGGVTAPVEVVTDIWLWQASGTITTKFTMTINSAGVIANGLTLNGLSLSGLTSSGLTIAGL